VGNLEGPGLSSGRFITQEYQATQVAVSVLLDLLITRCYNVAGAHSFNKSTVKLDR